MAVDDEADAEQAIEERRGRAGGHEGRGGEGHETRGEQTLERPVVRPVRPFRRREGRRVVHGALVDRCESEPMSSPVTAKAKKVENWDVRPPGT